MMKSTWRKTPFLPLKMKKGPEPRSISIFWPRLTQPTKHAKQASRVVHELSLTDVTTS